MPLHCLAVCVLVAQWKRWREPFVPGHNLIKMAKCLCKFHIFLPFKAIANQIAVLAPGQARDLRLGWKTGLRRKMFRNPVSFSCRMRENFYLPEAGCKTIFQCLKASRIFRGFLQYSAGDGAFGALIRGFFQNPFRIPVRASGCVFAYSAEPPLVRGYCGPPLCQAVGASGASWPDSQRAQPKSAGRLSISRRRLE